MHIPDGFLKPHICLITWIISVCLIGYCLKKSTKLLKDKTVPLMGLMGAFIFSAQMLNFPIAFGTSAHLSGGVLSAILLGPYAGAIVMNVVLIAQCLFLQDGGITTLGANILNISIIGAIVGYKVYYIFRKIIKGRMGILIGTGISSWLSVVVGAGSCAIQLSLSDTFPIKLVFPAMVGIYAISGLAEAIITCLIIDSILNIKPDLIY